MPFGDIFDEERDLWGEPRMAQRLYPDRQRKGPLRQIVKVWRKSAGPYDQGVVGLECGHNVKSSAKFKARCDKCENPDKV